MTTTTQTTLRAGVVALDVADLDRVAGFYRDALGLQVRDADGGTVRLGTGDRELVALHARPDAVPAPRASGLFHLALLYPSRGDLAEALLRLGRAGGRLDGASDHLVSEAVYLRDPEGNGIELYRDREREAWDWQDGSVAMATLPLDLRDVLATARTSDPAPTAPDATTMGHVHLQVADLVPTRRFYVELLGFDVMTESYPGALFVATGGYHHHVGLNTWGSQGRPAVPGARGLRHVTLEYADATAREDALLRLADVGLAPEDEVEDAPVVRDPSGNALRLALVARP
ncbi:VOC family protein [Patulibacter brassicae]|uniref:VOC family protein n=1 Tax=Patulibacter brassicae TaxID=1705717 RepID=A0ABU4VRR2_9ACTN|nr:VOC family protein [Patulibacter brassicae]MDX8153588.1 VOC family protein [Patulibacter brassicae]